MAKWHFRLPSFSTLDIRFNGFLIFWWSYFRQFKSRAMGFSHEALLVPPSPKKGVLMRIPKKGVLMRSTRHQGKEKQRDCLLFLFLVLLFASGVIIFFFALFARTMCGAGKAVLVDFLRLRRKVLPMSPAFRPVWVSFCVSNGFFANALQVP
jgi:hypothetical protein